MYNNNIPQNRYFNPRNFQNPNHNQRSLNFDNDDRFIGGGFLGPFLLGGVGGYLLGRPNYNYNGPIPVYISNRPPYYPMPYPGYYY